MSKLLTSKRPVHVNSSCLPRIHMLCGLLHKVRICFACILRIKGDVALKAKLEISLK